MEDEVNDTEAVSLPEEFEESMILDDDDDDDEGGVRPDPIVAATLNVSGDSSTDDALQLLQSKTLICKNLDRLEFQQHTTAGTNGGRRGSSSTGRRSTVNNANAAGPRVRSSSLVATTSTAKNPPHPHTVPEKIAHFESEAKKNVALAAATTSTWLTAPATHPDAPTAPPPRFQVVLRVRPSTEPDTDTDTVQIVDATKVRTHPPPTSYSGVPKEYTFDQVLPPSASQRHVYESTAAPLLSRVLRDKNSALLFCYGVTNSGKTYTVHGASTTSGGGNQYEGAVVAPHEAWGILPRVLHDLYTGIQSSSGAKELHVSFFEIYLERCYDLLPDGSPNAPTIPSNPLLRKALRLREDLRGKVSVQGLAVHKVESVARALQWMRSAKKNRVTCTNTLNERSSRSHFVCQLAVVDAPSASAASDADRDVEPSTAVEGPPSASFWVVDLAGSERSKRTQAPGRGMSQKEASTINSSNMVLMHCLMSLRQDAAATASAHGDKGHGQPYKVPPYRNSQLTRLLMPHWTDGSNTSTAMIVNVNPAASDYDESQHVLGYANHATTIQLPAAVSNNNHNKAADPKGAAAGPVQYDANGRRVKADGSRPHQQLQPIRKDGGGMRSKVVQVLRKLSPMRGPGTLKRKKAAEEDGEAAATTTTTTARGFDASSTTSHAAPSHPSKRLKSEAGTGGGATTSTVSAKNPFAALGTASARGSAKKPPPTTSSYAPNTVAVKQTVAYKKLKTELAVTKTSNEFLMEQNRVLEEKVKALEGRADERECEIRSSVMHELGKAMDQQRNEYEARIASLRQQQQQQHLHSVAKKPPAVAAASPYVDPSVLKVADLEDQIQEYEQDNQELREAVVENEARIEELVAECGRLRGELAKKESIIKDYRKLLEEEEVDEDEMVLQGDDVEEEEEEEDEDRRDTLLAEPRPVLLPSVAADHLSEVGSECDDDESRRTTILTVRPDAHPTLLPEAQAYEAPDANSADGSAGNLDRTDANFDAIMEAKEDVGTHGPSDAADRRSKVGSEGGNEKEEDDTRRDTLLTARPDAHPTLHPEAPDANSEDCAAGTDSKGNVDAIMEANEVVGTHGNDEASAEDDSFHVDSAGAKDFQAAGSGESENPHSMFRVEMSPKRVDGSTTKSPKPTSDRKPLGTLGANNYAAGNQSDDDNEEEEEEEDQLADLWLEPKVKAKIDPKTGMYKRPKGRKPSGVEDWDASKGKWRLSMA